MGKVYEWNGDAIKRQIEQSAKASARKIAMQMAMSARGRAPVRRDTEQVGFRATTTHLDVHSEDFARMAAAASAIGINPQTLLNSRGIAHLNNQARFPVADENPENRTSSEQRTALRGSRGGKREEPGTLKRSIVAEQVTDAGPRITWRVAAKARYAKYVEFPTRRTRAQPFMLPAEKHMRGTALDIAHSLIGGKKTG
jgi:HK97 gp10 family phage protein